MMIYILHLECLLTVTQVTNQEKILFEFSTKNNGKEGEEDADLEIDIA